MKISLEGKRAFVSAGAAGIGRHTVETLDRLGAEVFTCDIDRSALDSLPSSVRAWHCDVADSAEVNAVFDEIVPGGLDILVNNAGIAGPTKLVEDVTDDEWRECLAVGIDSHFYCARRAVPAMKAAGSGAIVNMISSAGIMGYPTRSPYVAAKWASAGLTKSLAMELGPDGIRVNGIVPGSVTGDRMERIIAAQAALDGADPEAIRRDYVLGVSMQCFIEPQEVADLIAFLVSDHARHVSGQIIGVDGNTETLWPRH